MTTEKLIDIVLRELVSTLQPSISIRRILINRKLTDVSEETIREIEEILTTKSLVIEKGLDSQGFRSFSLSETGRDFMKQFGTYDKYLKGLKKEERKTEKARSKQPYRASNFNSGEAPTPFTPREKTFLEKNMIGIILMVLFLMLFVMIANI